MWFLSLKKLMVYVYEMKMIYNNDNLMDDLSFKKFTIIFFNIDKFSMI